MARYLDPKKDITFKRIFGEHPCLPVSFLNTLMPLAPGRLIEQIRLFSVLNGDGILEILRRNNCLN
ncbi:MAG: hypothetical protein LBS42_02580 [Tannerella sp.]|jgi:hypothetical protein|nr:hypothetical protein [Tannerella sp.]